MKIKITIISMAVIVISVAAFAFNKPSAIVIKYIDENKITTSLIASIDRDELNVADNWTGTVLSFDASGAYLGGIEFNLDDANPANGGLDGDLTLQEAIEAVRAAYNTSTHAFSSYNLVIGTATITIHRKANTF